MKSNKGNNPPLNIAGMFVLACLVLTTFCLGVYGFSAVYVAKSNIEHAELTRWFDVLYSTIKLFSLISSPAEEAIKHWAISAARLTAACSVFFSIAFATFYAAGNWFKSNILTRFYKQHYVIFGLNDESKFLIDDLIKQKKKVVVVEQDHTNPLLTEYKKKPIAIILGDGSEWVVQSKASILMAHTMVSMTGCDLANLAILNTLVESPYKPNLHCHISIENVMSYKLFEPNAFYSIENIKKLSSGLLINIFNTNEQIAINLVKSMKLGANADTVSTSAAPVSILIAGFGSMGEAIMREVLLMSHFFNQKKADIVVLSEKQNDFFLTHHQVLQHCNGQGLDLWDIKFVKSEEELDTPSSFNHIIACSRNENDALKAILRLYDMCTVQESQETDNTTTFHYLSTLKHDVKHCQIKPFGSLKKTLNVTGLLNNKNEILAQKSHQLYAKAQLNINHLSTPEALRKIEQHDANIHDSGSWLHWFNQPLFKRRSNFTEKRHIEIKLLALGGTIPAALIKGAEVSPDIENKTIELPYLDYFSDLDKNLIMQWVRHIQDTTKLSDEQLIDRIHLLAQVEHNRWNAFHIVNNWRYGEQKNEVLKTHDCLLNWEELEKMRPDTIKYDYKNIYHIPESLALLYHE